MLVDAALEEPCERRVLLLDIHTVLASSLSPQVMGCEGSSMGYGVEVESRLEHSENKRAQIHVSNQVTSTPISLTREV